MNHNQNRYSDNRYSDGDPGPSRMRVPQGEEEAHNDELPDHSHILPFIPTNYFLNAPLRIYNPIVPSYASTSFLPSMPSSDDDGYIIAPCTPSLPPSVTVFEPILDQEDNYILAPCTPPETTSDNFGNFGPTFSAGTVSGTPMKRPAIFEDLHHSFKRRKLSGSNLQEMVDHINIDLDDYDIEDYDRGLPAYIYDLNLPLSERVRKNLDKARKKAEDKRKKAKDKRDAVREEKKRQRANIRSRDANAKPCPSCGNWDHERSTNKNCPHWRPRKPQETGLTRRSTVKTTLDGTCSNAILADTIKETVLKCRNLRHTASLFLNFLIIRRLDSGQPLPQITQSFFYHVFCQLVGKGHGAEQWIKDMYLEFQNLMPATRNFVFYSDTQMIAEMARQYTTAARQHISSNFEKRTTNYFFLRLNDSSDTWYLETTNVKERRFVAEYMYKRAAGLPAEWPTLEDTSISRAMIDIRTFTLQLGPTPVTEASLAANANQYMPWMLSMLHYMERRVLVQELQPQRFASKGYIFRNLKDILKGLSVPKSSFDSLTSHVDNAIRRSTSVNFEARKLRECRHILAKQEPIAQFVTTTIEEISTGSFRPAKYTDPKNCRRFTLMPLCSMQATHISLDKKTFPNILRRAGLSTGSGLDEQRYREICFQYFNFQNLGIHSMEDFSREGIEFSNVLRTDGCDLEVIFLKAPYPNIPPKTPENFRNWVVHGSHRSTIWGVDPGVTDLFVAADGSGTNPHRYRKTSTKEYYDLCNFNISKEKREQFRKQASPELIEVIDGIESLKTANMDTLRHAIQYRMDNFENIAYYYDFDRRFRKLKMKNYQGRQKGLDEICRRLTYGSNKYGVPPKPRHAHMLSPAPKRPGSWAPLPSCDRHEENRSQHYIIAFGNGACGAMEGKLPSPVKRLRSHLQKVAKRNVFISIIYIDEYNTSKVCAECHRKTLVKMERRSARPEGSNATNAANTTIHAVLRCTSCGTVWNRDELAAKNISFLNTWPHIIMNGRIRSKGQPTKPRKTADQ